MCESTLLTLGFCLSAYKHYLMIHNNHSNDILYIRFHLNFFFFFMNTQLFQILIIKNLFVYICLMGKYIEFFFFLVESKYIEFFLGCYIKNYDRFIIVYIQNDTQVSSMHFQKYEEMKSASIRQSKTLRIGEFSEIVLNQ